MNNPITHIAAAASPTILRALSKFDRVLFECDGEQFECSLKTAIFELKQRRKTLADIQLIDFDNVRDGPRSRQCQAIFDALLSSGLPDPVFAAAKANRPA